MNNTVGMNTDAISLCAYAKINIHLGVLGKCEDGLHAIESIFQRISIADYLSVAKVNGSRCCIVESPLMHLPTENTLTRAWHVFSSAAGVTAGVRIRLVKNIPAGSGLGGGSSDAAALLKVVNELFAVHCSDTELMSLALQVGSDVPFFLREAAGVVTGVGELFKPLHACVDCFGVLIWPGVQNSTKEAYRHLDEWRECGGGGSGLWGYDKLCRQYCQPIKSWCFANDFRQLLEQRYPVIGLVYTELQQHGADYVQVTGSGSSVYGLFASEHAAISAFNALKKKWSWCKMFVLLQ